MKNKKVVKKRQTIKRAFTIIELLAVIVILGILMLITIPSVTKYIDVSRKKSYIASVKSLASTLRYKIISEEDGYILEENSSKYFSLSELEVEKGKNPVQEGVLLVTKNNQEYTYKVKITKADNDYCIMSTDINNLSEDDVVSCKKMQEEDYKIGDIITFGESDWYVIKNSTYGDDYLTLLRAEVLPSNVIGEYSLYNNANYMLVQWTDTCHWSNVHGYTKTDLSGCSSWGWGYSGSKLEEMLNKKYLPLLGSDKLQEVDGYKIRLMNKDDFTNLGCNCYEQNNTWQCDCRTNQSSNKNEWVYYGKNINGYWTMIQAGDSNRWVVTTNGESNFGMLRTSSGLYTPLAVRPVINLLKTSIDQ